MELARALASGRDLIVSSPRPRGPSPNRPAARAAARSGFSVPRTARAPSAVVLEVLRGYARADGVSDSTVLRLEREPTRIARLRRSPRRDAVASARQNLPARGRETRQVAFFSCNRLHPTLQ